MNTTNKKILKGIIIAVVVFVIVHFLTNTLFLFILFFKS